MASATAEIGPTDRGNCLIDYYLWLISVKAVTDQFFSKSMTGRKQLAQCYQHDTADHQNSAERDAHIDGFHGAEKYCAEKNREQRGGIQ